MHDKQSDVGPRPNPTVLEQFADMVQAAATAADERKDSIELDHLALANPPEEVMWDVVGRRRSPATLRNFRLGKKPPNAGKKYPATPPTGVEVLRMLEAWPKNPAGMRGHATMVIQYRAGLRISEALDLHRQDLNPADGTVFVRCGKGGKSRIVGMDAWGFEQIQPWIDYRYARYPDGPVLCVVQGPTKGGRWTSAAARTAYHDVARKAGVERRFAPHQLRHAHACEMARENVPIHVISRQIGHSNVGTTAIYLAGISNEEIVSAIHQRPAPVAA